MCAKYLSTGGESKPRGLALSTQCFTIDTTTPINYGEAFGYILSERGAFGYISLRMGATPCLKLRGEVPYRQKIPLSDFVLGLAGPKDRPKGTGEASGVRSISAATVRGRMKLTCCNPGSAGQGRRAVWAIRRE